MRQANPTADGICTALATIWLILVLSGVSWCNPKSSKIALGVVIAIWFWTTTIWASQTKLVTNGLGSNELYPSNAFWLTLVPQVLSSVCLLVMSKFKDMDLLTDTVRVEKPNAQTVSWYVGGTAYFYGQLFTVMALAMSSPGIVFVVKAIEPLSTALLAIPVLNKAFSLPLFIAIAISCTGIVVTVQGSPEGVSFDDAAGKAAIWAMAFAVFANMGFSTRACVVKKAFQKAKMSPLETFGKVTIAGTITGLLPLLVWLVLHPTMAVSALSAFAVELQARAAPWFILSMCYLLYQCSSLLILDCIAVESHALMVAMKHIFVVVSASIVIGAPLTITMIVGIVMASAGVYYYSQVPEPESGPLLPQSEKLEPTKKEMTGLPPLLYGIVGGLVTLGVAWPLINA